MPWAWPVCVAAASTKAAVAMASGMRRSGSGRFVRRVASFLGISIRILQIKPAERRKVWNADTAKWLRHCDQLALAKLSAPSGHMWLVCAARGINDGRRERLELV